MVLKTAFGQLARRQLPACPRTGKECTSMPGSGGVMQAMVQVAVAAALVAAATFLYGAWPWRSASPAAAPVAAVLSVAFGFYIGCWLLGVQARWPAREDQERLLLVLLPAVIA